MVRPDPNAAYELLDQARDLAKSPTLRASYLFAMGRASLAADNFGRAIENFQGYLREYPAGADRFTVRLRLGEAQRKANQLLPARLTWTDLIREIERLKAAERTPAIDTIRSQALAEIPSTYGIPNPPDDTSLNLGVAAVKRFLDAAPAHPQAVTAAFGIGAAYQARGKDTQALDAYTRFLKEDGFKVETDEARRDWAALSMTASFRVGQILLGQQKFAEAIAAWKGYLARFPNGPQSADAQRAILGTQLCDRPGPSGSRSLPEARAAWSEFVTQNPLDARVPAILFQIGESFEKEKQFDRAIAAWEPLTSKFPDSEPAAHAQFQIGCDLRDREGDPCRSHRAIQEDRGRALAIAGPPADRRDGVEAPGRHHARAPSGPARTPTSRSRRGTSRRSASPHTSSVLRRTSARRTCWRTWRRSTSASSHPTLRGPSLSPDMPGTSRSTRPYDLKKLELPGVYVVKVTDEKTFQATTLVIGSDIDAIVKTSRDQVLVFAQDMKTGRGRAGARVLDRRQRSGRARGDDRPGRHPAPQLGIRLAS